MPGLKEIKGMVLTSADIRSAWEALTIPIPRGVMIYEIDTEKVKIGNGVNLYSELPYRIDAVLTQEQKTMLDAVNSVNGVLQLDSTGKISTSLLPAEFQAAVADTVVAKDDAEAAAVLAIDAKTAAENARDTTVDIATGLTGAAVPVGTEFMWFADPQDPLGGIPAGYVLAMGQELSRATYPDLFAFANTGGRILSEVDWQTQAVANDGNVGLYSSGDGSTTFRMPKILCFIRSGTTDKAGTYEGDATRNITGEFGSATSAGVVDSASNVSGAFKLGAATTTRSNLATVASRKVALDTSLITPTAEENRPKTIYRSVIVKAFSATVNQGNVDVTQLATDVTMIINKVGTLIPFDYNDFASFAELKPYNADAGTAVAGWNIRALNTTIVNNIAGCALNASAITLPAGSYWISASACAYNVGQIMLTLRDSTSGDIIISGESGYVANSNQTMISLEGLLTLETERTVQLSQYCGSGSAYGLGTSIDHITNVPNHYANIRIWRIA